MVAASPFAAPWVQAGKFADGKPHLRHDLDSAHASSRTASSGDDVLSPLAPRSPSAAARRAASAAAAAAPRPRPRGAVLAAVFSAAFYGAMAVSMNVLNKAALIHFPLPCVLLTLQMLSVLLLVGPARAAGLVRLPPLRAATARRLAPVTALYVANAGVALAGLSHLSLPMYGVLKRLTPAMVLAAKWRLTGAAPPRRVAAAVGLIVAGTVLAGASDLAFDAAGYACALASCGLQVAYLLLVERGAKQGVSTPELLVYNALLSLPPLAVALVLTGEAAAAPAALGAAAAAVGGRGAALLLGGTAAAGIALNYATFLCTATNSALTTTVVGSLKGVASAALGFFVLGGARPAALHVLGVALNTAGGVAYSATKHAERARAARVKAGKASPPAERAGVDYGYNLRPLAELAPAAARAAAGGLPGLADRAKSGALPTRAGRTRSAALAV